MVMQYYNYWFEFPQSRKITREFIAKIYKFNANKSYKRYYLVVTVFIKTPRLLVLLSINAHQIFTSYLKLIN